MTRPASLRDGAKPYARAIVVGKFFPPHRGHKYLIDTAAEQSERVLVMVADRPGQDLPAEVRKRWLQEIHADQPVEVMLIPDPLGRDEDSAFWASHTLEHAGFRPDAVFTSEEYGTAWAGYLGCVHVPVDPPRLMVPVSGTAVRTDPFANWAFLEPCVRAHYALRVCVVGAESTGKTTLARQLAEHYATTWVPEWGREYSVRRVIAGKGLDTWTTQEFIDIAAEQNQLEDLAARTANRVLICDTDAFATGIWHEHYMGFRSPEVEALAQSQHYDLYIVPSLDTPWEDDGLRDGGPRRETMYHRFMERLRLAGKRFVGVQGSRRERLDQAAFVIDGLVARPYGAKRPSWWS